MNILSDAGELKLASGDAAKLSEKTALPGIITAFSGMVFGDKFVAKQKPVKSQPVKKVLLSKAEPSAVDNGMPNWWMIAAALILGIAF